MDVLIIVSMIFTLLGTLASCDSEFIHPPNWDPETSDWDFNKNRRYVAGETVQLEWETDLDHVELSLLQAVYPIIHGRPLDSSRTDWETEYDVFGKLKDDEDAVYYFEIYNPDKKGPIAASERFNVTAPKPDKTKTVTAPGNTVTVSQAIPTSQDKISTRSTTTDTETTRTLAVGEGTHSSSVSKMTPGEVAGAGVGGTIGGILIIGGFGWLIWRRVAKGKANADVTMASQQQEPATVPKAELPGDNKAYPSNYATGPTGLYEAP